MRCRTFNVQRHKFFFGPALTCNGRGYFAAWAPASHFFRKAVLAAPARGFPALLTALSSQPDGAAAPPPSASHFLMNRLASGVEKMARTDRPDVHLSGHHGLLGLSERRDGPDSLRCPPHQARAIRVSSQCVVYLGVRRSCLIDYGRRSPSTPALAKCKAPRSKRRLTSSTAGMSSVLSLAAPVKIHRKMNPVAQTRS